MRLRKLCHRILCPVGNEPNLSHSNPLIRWCESAQSSLVMSRQPKERTYLLWNGFLTRTHRLRNFERSVHYQPRASVLRRKLCPRGFRFLLRKSIHKPVIDRQCRKPFHWKASKGTLCVPESIFRFRSPPPLLPSCLLNVGGQSLKGNRHNQRPSSSMPRLC